MNQYNKSNVFYKIINNEIPSTKVYEDDLVLCFIDIKPSAKTHFLLIPKGEYVNFDDFINKAKDVEKLHFFNTIQKITSNFQITDYKLLTNNGKNSGQEVMHFHIHIISNQMAKIDHGVSNELQEK